MISSNSNQINFVIRPWNINDLSSLVKHANNPNIAKWMTDTFPSPYTKLEGREFIAYAQADKPTRIFAIEINGEAVGGIGIHPQNDIHQKNAEIGYWLSEIYWGQNVITRALVEIVKIAFENYDISRVFARPFGNNFGSQRALEKAGFLLEAKFEKSLFKNGELLDEMIYAVRR